MTELLGALTLALIVALVCAAIADTGIGAWCADLVDPPARPAPTRKVPTR